MSVQVDIITQTIEVQIIQDEVVNVSILDGVSVLTDGTLAGVARAIEFLSGSNVSISAEKVDNKVRVTINSTASGGGNGDVTGPASSTDGEIVLYDGLTGKIIKNSSKVLTTVGGNIAALTNPGAITFLRINADNTVTARSATDFLTDIGAQASLGYTPRRVFYKNNNPSSLNNTTNETLMDSVLIPANTLQANDILQIYVLMTKSGTAGNVVMRVNVNTSASLAGDTLIGFFTGSSTGLWAPLLRKMIFQNSVTSQSVYSTGTSGINDEVNPNSAHTALTIDFTQNQYFTVSFQNGNIGDTTTLRSWFIEIIRT